MDFGARRIFVKGSMPVIKKLPARKRRKVIRPDIQKGR